MQNDDNKMLCITTFTANHNFFVADDDVVDVSVSLAVAVATLYGTVFFISPHHNSVSLYLFENGAVQL